MQSFNNYNFGAEVCVATLCVIQTENILNLGHFFPIFPLQLILSISNLNANK